MATAYRTRDGDSLDWICWRAYGRLGAGLVEAVLEANPGLADNGPLLPGGLRITLPEIATPTPSRRVRLWG